MDAKTLLNEMAADLEVESRLVVLVDGCISIETTKPDTQRLEIDLAGCDTAEKILSWVCYLSVRTWCTPTKIRRFIEVATEAADIQLSDLRFD